MESTLQEIDIGGRCKQSRPCRHNCRFIYNNGIKQKEVSGWSLIKNEYWPYVNNQSHFEYRYKLVCEKPDKSNYSLFLEWYSAQRG